MIEAGHIAAMMGKLPLPWQIIIDDCYRFTQDGENAEVLDGFQEEVVRILIAWHFAKRTLIFHRNAEQEIDGLLMWYRTDGKWTWEDIKKWRNDDPKGDTFFLAFLWARPGALKDITLELIRREPEVMTKKLCGLRARKDGPKLVRYDQRLLVKLLQQKNGKQIQRSATSATTHRRESVDGRVPLRV